MSFQVRDANWVLNNSAGERRLADIVEGRDQPFYLYDLEDAVLRADRFLTSGFSCHFAMKANSNSRVLEAFARAGLGVDVVSLGELQKAVALGFRPERVIFSGVAKDRREFEFALEKKIFQINVESVEELKRLGEVAQSRNARPDIALRLNIHLEAPTHKYIQTSTTESKFGIELERLPEVLGWLKGQKHLQLKALAVHIGSQIEDVSIFGQMAERMGRLYRELRGEGWGLERLDLGGGLGIDYRTAGEKDFERLDEYLHTLSARHGTDARISLEPGRFLVARMGVLLAKVVYVKQAARQKFVILNAGMNALMRPALYQAYHRIEPITRRSSALEKYTIVGPICESADTFGVDRKMPPVESGDWVAVFDSGAYGAVMANTYNESALPAEWIFNDSTLEVT